MKRILHYSILLFISCFIFSSCTKTVQAPYQTYAVSGTIRPSDWAATGTGGYAVSLSVPDVTAGVVSSGGVVTYISFNNGITYEALPEVVSGVAYGTYYKQGIVSIDLFAANGTSAVTPPSSTITVKILITVP